MSVLRALERAEKTARASHRRFQRDQALDECCPLCLRSWGESRRVLQKSSSVLPQRPGPRRYRLHIVRRCWDHCDRDAFLKGLQMVQNIVEPRQTLAPCDQFRGPLCGRCNMDLGRFEKWLNHLQQGVPPYPWKDGRPLNWQECARSYLADHGTNRECPYAQSLASVRCELGIAIRLEVSYQQMLREFGWTDTRKRRRESWWWLLRNLVPTRVYPRRRESAQARRRGATP
jgi:hypothetical protein